jgi:hypothetical protein
MTAPFEHQGDIAHAIRLIVINENMRMPVPCRNRHVYEID